MKTKSNFLMTFFLACFLSGCISGAKNLNQNFSEKIRSDADGSGELVEANLGLQRQSMRRKISGRVLCGESLEPRVAHRGEVKILNGNKVLGTARIESNGTYNMEAPILMEVPYQLEAMSTCGFYVGTVSLAEKQQTNLDIFLIR